MSAPRMVAIIIVGTLAVVPACGGGTTASQSSTPPSPVQPGLGLAGQGSAIDSSSGRSDVPSCHPDQLRLDLGARTTLYNQFAQTVALRNVSGTPCAVTGWPAIVPVDSAGHQLATSENHVTQSIPGQPPSRVVDLAPGRDASFDVFNEIVDVIHDRGCVTVSTLDVALPSGVTVGTVAVELPECTMSFEVSPLLAGAHDNYPWTAMVG